MPYGTLLVNVRAADDGVFIPRATVVVETMNGEEIGRDELTPGDAGASREFSVEAPPVEESLSPSPDCPYGKCRVHVSATGFRTLIVSGVQIFEDEMSILPADMIPDTAASDPMHIEIDEHQLQNESDDGAEPESDGAPVWTAAPKVIPITGTMFIPSRITVHLGAPNASAQNVTVPFTDYIKNVASSEIYPTWPDASLRANILCQISLALNRIYTEWYPSRGYSFDITNSTAYDQYYVYGRNIYENISDIVDEIFNVYMRRPGEINPYYAEYCDGNRVTCAGLSQWGTVSLANDGYNPLQILQFYYGNMELVRTDKIQSINGSYPGSPLSIGSSGSAVATIQQQLTRIAINYPNIPTVPVDGVYGSQTAESVRAFQRTFNLTPDGVVGSATWYRISFIYVAVKKLAELNSEGEKQSYTNFDYPGTPVMFGDTGTAVQQMQLYLQTIGVYNPFIPVIEIDGFFGSQTLAAVRAFQEQYGLFVDGIVGQETWNKLIEIYQEISKGEVSPRPFPGTVLKTGSLGNDVLYVQQVINELHAVFNQIPSVTQDSVYGPATANAVTVFQRTFGLTEDGQVGRITWTKLNEIWNAVREGCLEDRGSVSGSTLRRGSTGSEVSTLQKRLNLINGAMPIVPNVTVDGVFGSKTDASVRAFQRLFGLTEDGVVGKATRTRIDTVYRAIESGCLPVSEANTARAVPAAAPAPRAPESSLPDKNRVFCRCLSPLQSGQDVALMKLLLSKCPQAGLSSFGEKELFGRETYCAIRRFQEAQGLTPTGVFDEETRRCLWGK